jgi:ferredoxin
MKNTYNHLANNVRIFIHNDICNGCGKCQTVCPISGFVVRNHHVEVEEFCLSKCIECDQCVMSCPTGAILIEHFVLSDDTTQQQNKSVISYDYNNLLSLLGQHKGTFEFKDTAIDALKVRGILDTVQAAPIGLPPASVHVLVLNNSKRVGVFMNEISGVIRGRLFWPTKIVNILRRYGSTATYKIIHGYSKDVFDVYLENFITERKRFSFNAAMAMYFYEPMNVDKGITVNAAVYAMLAAENLGLKTCILGCSSAVTQHGKLEKTFSDRWGIDVPSYEGLVVLFGYS